nr:hypothetical protein [Tanacetum cinerariifolium]
IIMANLPPLNNDQNVPKDEQAPAAPDGKLNEEIRKRAKVDERIMKKTDKSDLRIRMVGCDAMSLDGVVRECQADVSKVISMMENMSLEFDRARNATMADDDVEADDVEDDDVEDDDDDMDDDVADPSDPQSSEPRGSPLAKALAADRSTRNTTGARGSGNVGGEGRALTWWNTQVATLGLTVVNERSWDDLKKMMLVEFCPEEEISRMEDELRHLRLKDND